ncbi:MAG: hypothetical protein ACXWTK_00085 [Methylobacter sp.]
MQCASIGTANLVSDAALSFQRLADGVPTRIDLTVVQATRRKPPP